MYTDFQSYLQTTLKEIEEAGLYKNERIIVSPQRAAIKVNSGKDVLNFCANNYLGLSDNQELIDAAKKALDERGFGMSSVRFICGTQEVHKKLEKRLSTFLGTDDTILYSSCFDANGGLFETLLTAEDAVISDELNHASIIDGVRLCKASRYRYANNDMADLEAKLQEAKAAGARTILISTDGVFSMDGIVASLDKIHELAEKHRCDQLQEHKRFEIPAKDQDLSQDIDHIQKHGAVAEVDKVRHFFGQSDLVKDIGQRSDGADAQIRSCRQNDTDRHAVQSEQVDKQPFDP